MTRIFTFFIVVLLFSSITSCKKSDDTSPALNLSGTEWQMSNEEFGVNLRFMNDSVCAITTGATDGRLGVNYSEYTYKRAFGIDLMILNHSTVEYTVNFLDSHNLQLSRSVENKSVDPIVLEKLK